MYGRAFWQHKGWKCSHCFSCHLVLCLSLVKRYRLAPCFFTLESTLSSSAMFLDSMKGAFVITGLCNLVQTFQFCVSAAIPGTMMGRSRHEFLSPRCSWVLPTWFCCRPYWQLAWVSCAENKQKKNHIHCSAVSKVWQSDSPYGEVTLPQLSLHDIHCSAVSEVWQSDSLHGEVTLPQLSLWVEGDSIPFCPFPSFHSIMCSFFYSLCNPVFLRVTNAAVSRAVCFCLKVRPRLAT